MLHLATINLVQLDDLNRPAGYASGCLIRYRKVLFVLTVAHATGNQGNWAMEIDFDAAQQKARLFQLGSMNYLRALRVKHGKVKARDIDFSYKLLFKLPVQPRFQIVSPQGVVVHDEPKVIVDSDLSLLPDINDEYGFWGCTRQSYNSYQLHITPKLETGMKFEGKKNDLFFFRTQSPYKTFKDYYGCSGAPILDASGRLVSLVVEGDKHKTGISGLPLHDLRAFLEVEIQQSQMS